MSNPAETYEHVMVPALFRPWAVRLINLANPQPGERVLDLGCGTGVVARAVQPLIGEHGAVSGLDLNEGMLAVARNVSNSEGPSIEWRQGRAEQLPYVDRSFDLVLCQFALMFFEDQEAALAEAHRVLTVEGRFVLSVFQPMALHPFYAMLDAAIERHLGSSGVGTIFALGDAGQLKSMIQNAGFGTVAIESCSQIARFSNPAGFLAGEIDVDTAAIPAMQNLDAEERSRLVETLQREMEAPLQEVTNGDHVEIPFHVHLATTQR